MLLRFRILKIFQIKNIVNYLNIKHSTLKAMKIRIYFQEINLIFTKNISLIFYLEPRIRSAKKYQDLI